MLTNALIQAITHIIRGFLALVCFVLGSCAGVPGYWEYTQRRKLPPLNTYHIQQKNTATTLANVLTSLTTRLPPCKQPGTYKTITYYGDKKIRFIRLYKRSGTA